MKNTKKGFTLIELLIVIGIIAILAGIVLVAVNPAQQFGKANDSERKSEIGMILSAIYQYQTSPSARGELPSCTIGTNPDQPIPSCGTDYSGALQLGTIAGNADNIDCSGSLVPSYLNGIPADPTTGTVGTDGSAINSGYYICQQTIVEGGNAQVVVIAPGAQVFNTAQDGGCTIPGTTTSTMCVKG